MKHRSRIVIDTSSVAKRCYFAGKDKEFGYEVVFEDKPVWVNGWQYGFENFLNYMSAALEEMKASPMDCIFVLEGEMGTSLRRNIFAGYKNRKGRPQQQLDEYAKMEERIVQFFRNRGAITAKQDGVEADDVVAYLAKNLQGQRYVLMDDGDGLILDNGGDIRVRYQSKFGDPGANPLGPFPVELNRLYKALVGDPSDTLPGAKGFGEKMFIDLFCALEESGCVELCRVINEADWGVIEKDAADFKPFKLIMENKDSVRRCYKVAGFFDHLVNTAKNPITWDVGMTLEKPAGEHADPRFDKWNQQRRLVTASNFAQVMASGIWAQIRQSPWVSLDLETSTPEESDDWLRLINSQDEDDAPKGVDVIASKISGLGLTFGDNQQFTIYLTVDHDTDKNITPEQLFAFLDRLFREDKEIRITVHNSSFELTVTALNLAEFLEDDFNSPEPVWECGFIPRIDDTLFMASYVNENKRLGLKAQAKDVLNYDQVTYEEVTQGRKMDQLTPQEVFNYGTDDTIVTSALRNYYEIIMQIEKTFDLYREVEIDAAYLVAAAMVNGTEFNREEMRKQEQADKEKYAAAWTKVRAYLVAKKWDGVELNTPTLEPASMKEIFQLVTGRELVTKVRKPSKIVELMKQEEGAETLAEFYAAALVAGDMQHVEAYARKFFKGEPQLNVDSPVQMCRLLYEVMELPIRVRNKPTADMKKAGIKQGNPAGNALAMLSAKFYDKDTHPEQIEIINSLMEMRSAATLQKMFYKPYRYLKHWKTNRIHGSYGQNMTVTGRFAPAKPNLAQLPKDKGDFRACFRPHHKEAVIVSLDFSAQELRVIADSSGDAILTSCYVGDDRKDVHSLTGTAIFQKKILASMTYEAFIVAKDNPEDPAHKDVGACRKKGKTVNFASEYGAEAPKMAETLMVPIEEAQEYLDAKHQTFWRAEEWKKQEVIPRATKCGYALTRCGRRRHLGEAFSSDDWSLRSRAERQAVNFEIQGSCGEMTKLAMGRMWRRKLLVRYDAVFFAPIHDEVVFSVHRNDAVAFIKELHECMIAQYADMKIPLESSIGIGLDFKHLIEIGNEPEPALIKGALKKLFPAWEPANESTMEVAA